MPSGQTTPIPPEKTYLVNGIFNFPSAQDPFLRQAARYCLGTDHVLPCWNCCGPRAFTAALAKEVQSHPTSSLPLRVLPTQGVLYCPQASAPANLTEVDAVSACFNIHLFGGSAAAQLPEWFRGSVLEALLKYEELPQLHTRHHDDLGLDSQRNRFPLTSPRSTASISTTRGPKFIRNANAKLATVTAPIKLQMYVHDPKECVFISAGLLAGAWEPDNQQLILNALRTVRAASEQQTWFVDIGANIGSYTMTMAQAGFNSVAFEPMLYNTELLTASIDLMGLNEQVFLVKAAVGAGHGNDMCVAPALGGSPDMNQGNGQLVPLSRCKDGDRASKETIQVNSVDNLLAGLGKAGELCPGAIKIDVEGYEALALRGARSLLRGPCQACLVLMEFQRAYTLQSGVDQHAQFSLLISEYGYSCWNQRSGIEVPKDNATWGQLPDNLNYVCTAPPSLRRCRDVVHS